MRNFILGCMVGAVTLYGSMCFHVVRARDATHVIPKMALTFTDTYVDIREFGVPEWRKHVPLAEALIRANKRELMSDALENSVRNAWDNLLESKSR